MCPGTSTDPYADSAFRPPWWAPRIRVLAPLLLVYGAVSAGPLALAAIYPTAVILDYARGGPMASTRSPWAIVGWLTVWIASIVTGGMYFRWIVGFWRVDGLSGLTYPGEEERRLSTPLLFLGRMQGPGRYRFDNCGLALSARVLPCSTTIATLWWLGAVFACARAASGEAGSAQFDAAAIYFFTLFLFQTGVFGGAGELRLERSNIERVEVEGSRVNLWVRGLFEKQAESISFVVSRAECPTFFSRFQEAFPDLLPATYAETARRVERFYQVNAAAD